MSGVEREIFPDSSHNSKHLPNTPKVQKLLRREQSAHVFNDESTMERIAETIIDRGEYTGTIRGYERYGLFFAGSIGYRIDPDGSKTPLFYGEIKINAADCYHVIPRTRPS